MGFDYFYGFMGGDTSQWTPGNLFRDTTQIYPFETQPGFNLITAMADEAIGYMGQLDTLAPDQPWLVYYAPGGTHAPHHPTPEWIDKIEAMHLFDGGWNQLRDTIFANQKRLGVIPASAELTPWPSDLLKNWDQLTPDEKKMFIRQADVYGAYLAYTDHEIGRVIQQVEDMGDLDNTLIIYISGDNGSSAEGTLLGTPNEVAAFNGVEVPVDVQLKDFYDIWGSELTYNHMAVPWSWAFDTPYQVDQADRDPLRRHQAGHGDLLAEGHIRQGWRAHPVRPRHRHRPNDPRVGGHSAALGGGRHPAEPDGGNEPRLHL
jgi:arylsulfatase